MCVHLDPHSQQFHALLVLVGKFLPWQYLDRGYMHLGNTCRLDRRIEIRGILCEMVLSNPNIRLKEWLVYSEEPI